ncbi:hypothetical protein ACEV93_25010, partial [Vibrio parahaemolyticus]
EDVTDRSAEGADSSSVESPTHRKRSASGGGGGGSPARHGSGSNRRGLGGVRGSGGGDATPVTTLPSTRIEAMFRASANTNGT